MNIVFLDNEDWTTRAIASYGNDIVQTPALDRLAASGVRFTRAYCQSPICNASRASFTTGLRPATTRIYGNYDPMDERLPPGAETLPEILLQKEVYRANVGKFFHESEHPSHRLEAFDRIEFGDLPSGYDGVSTGYPLPPALGRRRRPFEYSSDPKMEAAIRRLDDELGAMQRGGHAESRQVDAVASRLRKLRWEVLGDSGELEETQLDGRKARLARHMLEELADSQIQFFLSVGFTRPHVPLTAPANYVALYPPENIPLSPAPAADDRGIPAIALRNGLNYDIFSLFRDTPERSRRAIAAYYACATFVDAQIGLLLETLEETGLAENTIVVFFADHGFHLGEHGLWSKLTLFDPSIRVPLIVRVPGAAGQGRICDALVELVDLVPTLCELWELKPPPGIEGTSFVPLLEDPDRPWKNAAFSVCRRNDALGRAITTRRHKYTEWRPARWTGDEMALAPEGVGFRYYELYDLQSDPWEQVNLAEDPAHAVLRADLAAKLAGGWREARPGSMVE